MTSKAVFTSMNLGPQPQPLTLQSFDHLCGFCVQVSLPDSVIETSRPVKLKDFAEHYRIMSADSDFR